jgi:hypothetical protein
VPSSRGTVVVRAQALADDVYTAYCSFCCQMSLDVCAAAVAARARPEMMVLMALSRERRRKGFGDVRGKGNNT